MFDKVLIGERPAFGASPTQEFASIQRFTSFVISLIPGTIITQLSIALLILTLLKGVFLYCSNYYMSRVGQGGRGYFIHLVGLIPRFHDPTSGALLIDGTDIREYTQSSIRKQIAIVTQETFLFNDTVRNNIAYGDVSAPEEKILAASRAALADDFIDRFPMRYKTLIGERGQRLSGGERQRISIARALLKNAPILILDEATSSLDSESEKLVQQALTNLIKDRTTFVIAHRLSTIRNADTIIVLDQGRIVESGTHEALMENDGPYRRFFRLQMEQSLSSPEAKTQDQSA